MAGNKNESADATAEIKNMHKKDLVRGLWEYLGAKCSTILNFNRVQNLFSSCSAQKNDYQHSAISAKRNKDKYAKM